MGPPHACHARGAPLLCCSVGLDEHVSDEEADPVDEDGDVRRALTEAFMAKSKRQPGVLGTGSGTDAAGLGEEGEDAGNPGATVAPELERPEDCKNQ